jgi:phytoene synthase
MATLADLEAYAAAKPPRRCLLLRRKFLPASMWRRSPRPPGIAYAIAGLLRAFPLHAARGQLYVPMELLERHQVRLHDIFAGRSSPGLHAALAELRDLARRHLDAAHEQRSRRCRLQAMPAFLPVALVRPSLDRLERSDPFAPAEIPPWRRQWLIWRAARNPARIAG